MKTKTSHDNQEKALQVHDTEVNLTQQDIDILVTVGALPKGSPPDVVKFFARACSESGLSPFKRQIHLIKRFSKSGDRYTVQTGIDGYRAIANRTRQYAGNDDYLFDEGKTEYGMIASKRNGPTTATATVYRVVSGIRCPFSATARWEEYCPEGNQAFMWNKMPFLMLGKCAEALALRKAFPEELGGLYTDEEMAQAEMAQADKSNTLQRPEERPLGKNEQRVQTIPKNDYLPKDDEEIPMDLDKVEIRSSDDEKQATERKTMLQVLRNKLGKSRQMEMDCIRFFRNVKAEKGQYKGFFLLAQHDTFETVKLEILEAILKSINSWLIPASEWAAKNPPDLNV